MSPRISRPKWWQLYLTFPLLIALFAVDHRLKISTGGHELVQLGILAVIFGITHVWLNANSNSLSRLDRSQYSQTIRVIQVPVHELQEQDDEKGPMFELPSAELKGLLSVEFEMDSIRSEPSSAGRGPQESKKG